MPKKYFLLFLYLLFCACAHTNNFKEVELISVYDGDTFKVNLPCKKDIFCKGISVRVKGIDTPEINSKNSKEKEKAIAAKSFTEKILSDGKINLKNCLRDKYFRLLCAIFVKQGKKEINLTEQLLLSEFAIKYDGKTKKK